MTTGGGRTERDEEEAGIRAAVRRDPAAVILTTEGRCASTTLDHALMDGRITEDDADAVRMFQEYLTDFMPAQPASVEHARRQIMWLTDHREFLDFSTAEAARLIAQRERWIARKGTEASVMTVDGVRGAGSGARECVCGADIRLVDLPADFEHESVWVHVEGFNTLCYPDDDLDCHAEPYDGHTGATP